MTEQNIMDRAIIADKALDEPIKSDKWRNLWFLKSGETFEGCKIYPSKSEAINGQLYAYTKQGERILITPNMRVFHASEKFGRDVFGRDLSHAIPMPIKD